MSDSIICVYTLCCTILAGMMDVDETNWFPYPDRNSLLLSLRRTFDLSSFKRLVMYSLNHSFQQTVLLVPEF